jgi:hypothetical protein
MQKNKTVIFTFEYFNGSGEMDDEVNPKLKMDTIEYQL